MSRPKTRHQELCDLLVENGFDGGWVLVGEILTVWEHEQDPPAPLVKLGLTADEAQALLG